MLFSRHPFAYSSTFTPVSAIAWNAAAGSLAGTLSVVIPRSKTVSSYTLDEDAEGRFEVVGTEVRRSAIGTLTANAYGISGRATSDSIEIPFSGIITVDHTVGEEEPPPPPPPPPDPDGIVVENKAQLDSAIAAATGGELILLKPASYGTWNLSNKTWATPITLRSYATGDKASFFIINFTGVTGINFDDLLLNWTNTTGSLGFLAFEFSDCHNMRFTNNIITGPLQGGYALGVGLMFNGGCSGIHVEGNDITQWWKAVRFLVGGDDIKIVNNDIYWFREDAINLVSCSNWLIEGNKIHDRNPAPTDLGHPDGIQFWEHAVNGVLSGIPNENFTIRGNWLYTGAGKYFQSIFSTGSKVNGLVEDNVIYNGHQHGITVDDPEVIVRNNTLLYNSVNENPDPAKIPRITASSPLNNIEPSWWNVNATSIAVVYGNPGHANSVENLFVNALAGATATLPDLKAQDGNIIYTSGKGADMTRVPLMHEWVA